jgi:hypothetical protein
LSRFGPVSATRTLLNSASTASSTYTSNPVLVADARQITLSVQTGAAAASRVTLWATNYDGFQTALAENTWSVISTILSPGVYTIDSGMRWLRASRSAIDSMTSVIVTTRT